eukprot:CAMPEP_0117514422 /NCGR_PEP_ID=MMETSP0784-20121206/30061_1 /TAXON_ID=39447 /ORGANISM="" /LENGTH=571 /DNA_ID=CAMNT_0005310217 /DNA_START=69 /DNA_END=1781 /DNA_ORIENTATION=+
MSSLHAANISKQLLAWDSELEEVDQKQASLTLVQWKLFRHQSGMLAQQVMDVKKEVQGVNSFAESIDRKLLDVMNEQKGFEKSVKDFVFKMFNKVDGKNADLRRDLEESAEEHDRKHSDVLAMHESLSSDRATHREHLSHLDNELNKLHADVKLHGQHCAALEERLGLQSEESRVAMDRIVESHRDMKERLEDEIRSRTKIHEEFQAKYREFFERARRQPELNGAQHRNQASSLPAGVASCKEDGELQIHESIPKLGVPEAEQTPDVASLVRRLDQLQEEMPVIRGKLSAMSMKHQTLENESIKRLEAQMAEQPQNLAVLERRLEQLQATVAQESTARNSMGSLFDQSLQSERTKVANMLTQKVAQLKQKSDDTERQLHERLDNEALDRESHVQALRASHESEINAFRDRMSTLESSQSINEEKLGKLLRELRDLEKQSHKIEDKITSINRKTMNDVVAMIHDERAAREATIIDIERQLEWYGEGHDKLRELFINLGGLSVRKAAQLSPGDDPLTSPRAQPRADSPTPRAQSPRRSPLESPRPMISRRPDFYACARLMLAMQPLSLQIGSG